MTIPLEPILKRERALVIGALAGIVALAWIYILAGAGTGMTAPEMSALPTAAGLSEAMAAMQPMPWTAGYAALMLVMWWLMMAAMMLPSAAPTILLYAAVMRKQQQTATYYVPATIFAAGYLTLWGAFGVLAVLLQWGLERIALLSAAMVVTSLAIGSLLLIGAGLWQFTPWKYACLNHCRSPLQFIAYRWRQGSAGAFRMGLEHGAYCLGCCWVLMLLLFYGGVMNVYWIAGLTTLVLIEKIAPGGPLIGKLIGIALIGWGTALLAAILFA
ncbi:MAG: DUF2182 domain-containing protein [Hyphomicrobiaceae bacterium]